MPTRKGGPRAQRRRLEPAELPMSLDAGTAAEAAARAADSADAADAAELDAAIAASGGTCRSTSRTRPAARPRFRTSTVISAVPRAAVVLARVISPARGRHNQ